MHHSYILELNTPEKAVIINKYIGQLGLILNRTFAPYPTLGQIHVLNNWIRHREPKYLLFYSSFDIIWLHDAVF